MTVLSDSIVVLCCSLFVASLIKLIAPSGKTEKILKLTISLFVLICLITCIKTVISEIKILNENRPAHSEKTDSLNQSVDEQVLKVTGDYMVSYIENLLILEDIKYREVTVTVNSDEQGVINITDICIYMDKRNADANKASAIVENDLKTTPRVVFEE